MNTPPVPLLNVDKVTTTVRCNAFGNPSEASLPFFLRLNHSGRKKLHTLIAKPPCSSIGSAASSSNSEGFSSQTKALRRLLESPGVHLGPACYDALSAKLVEKAGFQICFTSGFSISAARLALPDAGLISFGEMLDQGRQITQALSIPVIGDGDNGYGNAMNVKRTVKEYIRAGFAGIILEDQVSPKACGHTRGRQVVSREEAVMRIKAAIDARDEAGRDIVIVARTDARQAISFEESLWRCNAFAEAGADVLFIDALASEEEMKVFCRIATSVPKMGNMLEGGGKTPILSPMELEEIGYKLIAYPLSLIGVSIQAMQDALTAIKGGRIPPPGRMPSFEELKNTLGFNDYYDEEKRYSIPKDGEKPSPHITSDEEEGEGDERREETSIEVVAPEVDEGSGESFSGIWSTKLRITITARDGEVKLDVRIPAGFMEGFAGIVPALGGINVKKMVEDAAAGGGGKTVLGFTDANGDRIEVSLE